MKKRLISIFYLLVFLCTKIILWFQKPKRKTTRVFSESSSLLNIFHPMTPIGNQIYLGSCVQASNCIFLEHSGITHIVNVSKEIPNFYSNQFHYYNLRIHDNGLESLEREDLDKVGYFIEEALHRLVEIHYHLGMETEAKKYTKILGYNYNSSRWFEKSYKVFNKDYDLANKKFKKEKKEEKSIFNKIIKMIKK